MFSWKCDCDRLISFLPNADNNGEYFLLKIRMSSHTWNVHFIHKQNKTWKEKYLRPMISLQYVQNTRIAILKLSVKTLNRPKQKYPVHVTTPIEYFQFKWISMIFYSLIVWVMTILCHCHCLKLKRITHFQIMP